MIAGRAASHDSPDWAADTGTARRILAERYARGELDIDEYQQRLSVLG